MAEALPPARAVLLSDEPTRLLLLHAYTALSGKDKGYLFLDTVSLAYPDYHRFLARQYPRAWESNPPKGTGSRADPLLLVHVIAALTRTNSLYYLHPSFGYYFEWFRPEPHGLVYKLVPYPTNSLFAPLPNKEQIAENEAFWAKADKEALQPVLSAVAAPDRRADSGLMDRLMQALHVVREPNREAAAAGRFYSQALDYWAVELQKCGRLTNAAAHFQRALELNSDNLVAQVNLECNRNLQAGRETTVQLSRSIEDEFGKYRNWEAIMGENGPFDEPNFCFEQGRVFARNNLYRQAAAEFDRARVLAPENLSARIWLAQLYVISRMPGEALRLIDQIRAEPNLLQLVGTNRTELLFVETSAHLAKDDLPGAQATVQSATAQYPGDAAILATATQVYMNYGRYSNALNTIEQELKLAPTNTNALVNKGFACIQVGAFEQAIPPLTRALAIDTNNYSALLNRAIASLRADKLEPAQRDYEVLQKDFPTTFQIYYGLGEIAWRKKETNVAARHYQLYLANAPTNTAEAKFVAARLKELKPGSP
jgi:tetratricopeptide (TPR) repeat protein